jgi:hypothetical protein
MFLTIPHQYFWTSFYSAMMLRYRQISITNDPSYVK